MPFAHLSRNTELTDGVKSVKEWPIILEILVELANSADKGTFT